MVHGRWAFSSNDQVVIISHEVTLSIVKVFHKALTARFLIIWASCFE